MNKRMPTFWPKKTLIELTLCKSLDICVLHVLNIKTVIMYLFIVMYLMVCSH